MTALFSYPGVLIKRKNKLILLCTGGRTRTNGLKLKNSGFRLGMKRNMKAMIQCTAPN